MLFFFDVENIAFSHHNCNAGHTRNTKYSTKEEKLQAKKDRWKEVADGRPLKREATHKKLTLENIQWAKENTEFSLREKARQLGVHHETLRRHITGKKT